MPTRPTLVAICSTLAVAAACASPPASRTDAAVAKVAQGSAPTCRTERPTGSRVPMRVCRTPEEMAAQRSAARDSLPKVNRPGRALPTDTN